MCRFYLILIIISSSLVLFVKNKEGDRGFLLNGQNPLSATKVICQWLLISQNSKSRVVINHAGVSELGFGGEWVTSNTSEKRKPVIDHFDSPVWRLIQLFLKSPSRPSSLLNMVVIHSMMYLYYVLCVLFLCSTRFPL